jgi:iron complex outermembrane receptor protein
LAFALAGAVFSPFPLSAAATDADASDSSKQLKQLSVEELMDIEVTSVSKQPEKVFEAPSAIEVLTNEDILRSGASSIPEALELADNLDVARKNAHDWAITARGFNTDLANKLLVLVDGRSVYTPLFSGVFWDRQDYLLEDLDRIEVISGPGGTLWGANAVNGVINITSKSARDTQGLYLEAGGGSELRDFTGGRFGGTLAPNVYYRVYGKYTERGDEVLPTGQDAADSARMGQGGFRIDAEPSPQNRFTLQGDIYHGDDNLNAGGNTTVSGGNVLGRWSHNLAEDSDLSLQVYYDRTHLTEAVPGLVFAPAGTFADGLDTIDVDFQHHWHPGKRHNVVWGLGYRHTHDVVGNAPALAFFPPVLDQNLYSGFAQDEIALQENWHLTLGTKLEHNDYTGVEVEPSVRLQWNPTPKQMVWSAISRAVRTPSRVDRDLSEPAPGYLIVLLQGSPKYASESVVAYELGYRAQLGPQVTASLSTFVNSYDDVRSTGTSPPDPLFHLPFPFYFQNNLEGTTYGFELSANYQVLAGWRLHGGYDVLQENIHVKPGQTDFNNGLNELGDPRQRLSLRSSLDLPGNLALDTMLRWVDSRRLNNSGVPYIVPSYAELDVRLAWRVNGRLELSLVGQNLLHNHHLEYGIPSPTEPMEEIQRSVYGKATWRY